MQINLPDHPKIASKALSAGFDTVEAYVRHLVEEDAGPLVLAETDGDQLCDGEWRRRFDALLASLEPGNPAFDDSRESIYPVR